MVDGGGEALEPGAGAEELRPHRQDDEQPIRLGRPQADQMLDEQAGLLRPAPPRVREHLLELIDEQADEGIARAADHLDERLAAVAAAIQDAAQLKPARIGIGLAGVGRAGVGQRFGQVDQRLVARRHHPRDPLPAAARRVLFQARQHAGADQRALAAAGVAVDHEQPLPDQPVDDVVDHLLAAEEDRPLVLAEGAQPRIRRAAAAGSLRRRRMRPSRRSSAPRRGALLRQPRLDVDRPRRPGAVDPVDLQGRAVRRRASVAIGAPAVSTRPHGT